MKVKSSTNQKESQCSSKHESKWLPHERGALKLNVDASVFPGMETFSISMVLRNHSGTFLAGKNIRLPVPTSVFEAEALGVREALS